MAFSVKGSSPIQEVLGSSARQNNCKACYLERLEKFFILHMPRFFISVWKMVSRFLEKIVTVNKEEERINVIKEIGEETLPEEYGGRAKLVLVQDVILPQLKG